MDREESNKMFEQHRNGGSGGIKPIQRGGSGGVKTRDPLRAGDKQIAEAGRKASQSGQRRSARLMVNAQNQAGVSQNVADAYRTAMGSDQYVAPASKIRYGGRRDQGQAHTMLTAVIAAGGHIDPSGRVIASQQQVQQAYANIRSAKPRYGSDDVVGPIEAAKLREEYNKTWERHDALYGKNRPASGSFYRYDKTTAPERGRTERLKRTGRDDL